MLGASEFHPTDKGFFHDPRWIEFIPEVGFRKPGWTFDVASDMLLITLVTEDTDKPGDQMIRTHNFRLPACSLSYIEKALFVLESIIKVEVHEAREAFEVGGKRPFVPKHGDSEDIYKMPYA